MVFIVKVIDGVKKIIPVTADVGAGNPVGTLVSMYKKSNPSGYLYCDGSTFDETAYPLLYAYLGSNVLPDYRECALVGAEQNGTDTIATHDVFTEGEFKDDQLQDHKHKLNIRNGSGTPGGDPNVYNGSSTAGISGSNTGTALDASSSQAVRKGTVTRGKRKAVYFYIKATSGLSENAQDNVINTLNEQRSYSTEEHLTGKKWIDGKPIYRKTVSTGELPNTTTKTIAHNITNLDTMVDIYGVVYNSQKLSLPLPRSAVVSTDVIDLYAGVENIVIGTGSNRSNYSGYVTIEYTKTT